MWPRFYRWDRYGVVLIWSTYFRWQGRRMGPGKQPRAAAFGPVILLRDEGQAAPWLFNHERIHVVQALELGLVGFWILHYGEYAYASWWLGKSK